MTDQIQPHHLKILEGFLALAQNVDQTSAVFDVADGLRETGLYPQFIEHARTQAAQVIDERYFAPVIDLRELMSLPKGSLGYCYASQMIEQGLEPKFYRELKIEDDYSYIAMRMRETHDIWHIVTGFDTSVFGEAALQAFTLAQLRSPLAVALLGAFFANSLAGKSSIENLLNMVQQGLSMGSKADCFLAEKWEEGWGKSLEEWRQKMNVNAFG